MCGVHPDQPGDLGEIPVDPAVCRRVGLIDRVVELPPPHAVVEVVDRLVGIELDVDRVAAVVLTSHAVEIERVEVEAVVVVGARPRVLEPLELALVGGGLPVDVSVKRGARVAAAVQIVPEP